MPLVPTTMCSFGSAGMSMSGMIMSLFVTQRRYMSSSVPSALISARKALMLCSRSGIWEAGEMPAATDTVPSMFSSSR